MRVPIVPVIANGNALVPRGGSCGFSITANGGPGGKLGQLPDGQNRIGDQSLTAGSYYIDVHGGLTDSAGRGCILTPLNSQFQCDFGATPSLGFSVASNGTISYEGTSSFVASPTEANGGYNIYLQAPASQQGCIKVVLVADNCKAPPPPTSSSGPPPSSPSSKIPPPPPTSSSTPPSPPNSTISHSTHSSSGTPSPPSSSSRPTPAPPISSKASPPSPTSSKASPPPHSSSKTSPPAPPPSSKTPQHSTLNSTTPPPSPSSKASVPPAPSSKTPRPPPTNSSSPHQTPSSSSRPPAPPASTSVPPPPPSSSSTPIPSNSSATPRPRPSVTSSSCPAALTGAYEYPHLIVPIDASKPNKALGTSYFGEVSGSVSSIFNFDIPASYAGKTCSLVFLFPNKSSLETSDFNLTGTGAVNIFSLTSGAADNTTYNHRPAPLHNIGQVTVQPGNTYAIATDSCPAGKRIGIELSAYGNTYLSWFQDYNPSPIGLYVTVC